MKTLNDTELYDIESRYTSTPVPPCRVCGAPLECGMIGQGRAVYHCSSEEANTLGHEWGTEEDKKARNHRDASEVIQTSAQWGDRDVLALVAEVRRLRKQNELLLRENPEYLLRREGL